MIGEIWEDASNKISYGKRRNYILGGSLQAAMNYPFRDLIINLLNGHRSSQDVAHQLMTLQENYPKDILLPPKGVNDFKFIFPLGGSPPFINRGYANDIAPILHILFPDVRNCNTDK